MKVNRKIILSAVFAGLLFSCSKDYSVEKNLDLSWEIDKAIVEDDIRERIGYDPRFTYPYILQNEGSIDVYAIGDETITNTYTTQVKVSLTKKLEENTTVALEFNPELYEAIKSKYEGYSLAQATAVTLESEKVIEPGQTEAIFTFHYIQRGPFNQNLLVPFTLKYKGTNSRVKSLDSADDFVLKIQQTALTLTLTPRQGVITQNVALKDGRVETKPNHKFDFSISTTQTIPFNISIEADYNNEYVVPSQTTLIPASKLTYQGVKTIGGETKLANFSIPFDATYITQEGMYAAQFFLTVKMGTQTFRLPTPITGNVVVKEGGVIPELGNVTSQPISAVNGLPLISKDGMIASGVAQSGTSVTSLIDGIDDFGVIIREGIKQPITLELGGPKMVRAIRIKSYDPYLLSGFDLYGSSPTQENVHIATVTSTNGNEEIIVKFDTPVELSSIQLRDYKARQSTGWIVLNEIWFYE